MALHSLYCADVLLRNCSLTHSLLSIVLLLAVNRNDYIILKNPQKKSMYRDH